MIKINNLTKVYRRDQKDTLALNNLTYTFEKKGMTFIIGKSGSGKSTLLHLLGNLLKPTSGSIEYDFESKDIIHNVGFIFQDYNLINDLTVKENLKIAYELKNIQYYEDEIIRILKKFDMLDLIDKNTGLLSGGEAQRVSIIRAILTKPKIILADEPTGNLDTINSKLVNDLLQEISKDTLVAYVTHDLEVANIYANTIIELKDGNIQSIKHPNKLQNIDGESEAHIIRKNASLFPRLFKLSNRFTFKKPVRFGLSIMSFVLSSLLLLLTISLNDYHENSVISNYFSQYNINEYVLYEVNSYQDLFNQKNERKAYKGSYLKSYLEDKFEDDLLNGIKFNQLNSTILTTFNTTFVESRYFELVNLTIEGEVISLPNEVLVSDYLALSNNLSIGDTLMIAGINYLISGIYKTDFVENDYIIKKTTGNLNPIDRYSETYRYLNVFVLQDNLTEIKNNDQFRVDHFQLMREPTLNQSLNSNITFSANIVEEDLIFGRLPETNNEIVLDLQYAQFLNMFDGVTISNQNLYLYDYHKTSFNHTYADILDLNGYFESGLTVVGIRDNPGQSVYLNQEMYQTIKSVYYDHYYFDQIMLIKDNYLYESSLNDLRTTIKIEEPVVQTIYMFKEMLKTIELLLISVVVVLMIISVSLLVSTLLTIFYEAKNDLAILKSLGLTNAGVKTIFSIQSITFWIIKLFLLIVVYYISIYLINIYYNSLFVLKYFEIYLFDLKSLSITSLIVFAVILLSNQYLIHKITKFEVLDILKSDY
ncbi:Lipoprotein-releasing system ATP-binding protein LolD [Acholeplasma oculi]|uniref:MacB-like ABC transporter, periplasmic core domain and ATPase n=1 Tax=Acholeplasma oculi TaxID=35623 RepID=A0A061A9Q9_9MOLU|nr:ATP-binding cassette domain-containing protein [Acholeplasma oculi]CDR30134.1 MacB-like ABC transporter, periplasmic core domain and ATPase [Acholeplasma oculi]SKC44592.1 ABC-type lipoprotein export system, ATPase component [Acholeplasma oculi]SUT88434.1 Lipoprotein-releasing system ATP-binding protein LolD [Acholeplasma oculi]